MLCAPSDVPLDLYHRSQIELCEWSRTADRKTQKPKITQLHFFFLSPSRPFPGIKLRCCRCICPPFLPVRRRSRVGWSIMSVPRIPRLLRMKVPIPVAVRMWNWDKARAGSRRRVASLWTTTQVCREGIKEPP